MVALKGCIGKKKLTIISLDVLEAVCAADLEVHFSKHNARLGVEDAQVGVCKKHRVPQAVDGHFGNAVGGVGIVEAQVSSPGVDGDDVGSRCGGADKGLGDPQGPLNIVGDAFEERASVDVGKVLPGANGGSGVDECVDLSALGEVVKGGVDRSLVGDVGALNEDGCVWRFTFDDSFILE